MTAALRDLGIRITAQRAAVVEVLARSLDHPSAQDVYERVRGRFPQITRATVYNTLRLLSEKGFVQPLHFRGGTRYDGNPHPHANLICVRCGGIADAETDGDQALASLREQLGKASGFRVTGQRLDFYGVCARCTERPGSARARRRQT